MTTKQRNEIETKRDAALKESEKLNLPAPRLQLTWFDLSGDWSERACAYSIVIPLDKYDIRAEDDEGRHGVNKETHGNLGLTMVSGGALNPAKRVGGPDSPFRDGAHSLWDSRALGSIPIYVVCGNAYRRLEEKRERPVQSRMVALNSSAGGPAYRDVVDAHYIAYHKNGVRIFPTGLDDGNATHLTESAWLHDGYPDQLIATLRWARANGYHFVLLDPGCTAVIPESELPTSTI